MENKLAIMQVSELKQVEPSKAEQIRQTFEPMAEMLEKFEKKYNEILTKSQKEITKEIISEANSLRLKIVKVRTGTEKLRKEKKEEYLRAGKAIDGVSNLLKWAVADKEGKLIEIEKHFENKEKERLAALQAERAEKLSKYVEDASERNLSSMDSDVWEAYFITKKKEYEDKIAAEKKAEADKIAKEKAEAEEREKIKAENERLKKEAEIRAAREAKEKKERERKEAEEKEKYLAKIKKEQEARAKIELELKAKKEAEEKALMKLEEQKEAELSKGDKEKKKDLLEDLRRIYSSYVFKSKSNIAVFAKVQVKLKEAAEILKTSK